MAGNLNGNVGKKGNRWREVSVGHGVGDMMSNSSNGSSKQSCHI